MNTHLTFLLRLCQASALTLPLSAQAANLMPPTGLPDAPPIAAAAGTQRNAAAAAGANATLVVFEDDRAGDRDIFAVRVDAFGQPVDAVPFAITKAPANQTVPRVVWNGQEWLCVYKSEYDPGSGYFATQLRAQRISANGVVLDPVPLALADDATGLDFAIGSDGQGFVVAWTGQSGGNSDVRARRITAAGAALDGAGVIVQPASFQLFFDLQVAYAGNTWLFAWRENGARGRRFSPTLTAIDAAAVALPTELGTLRGNGSQFLGNWIRQTPQFTQARRKSKHRSQTTRDPPPRTCPLRANPSTRPQPHARTDPRSHSAAFPPREHTAAPQRPPSGRNFAAHRHSEALPSSASSNPAAAGGARHPAGSAPATVSPSAPSTRAIAAGSWIAASTRRGPAHCGQTSTSMPNVRSTSPSPLPTRPPQEAAG